MSQPVHAIVMRRFDVAAERVFDACLDPAWVSGWLLQPETDDERVVRLVLEARVGGRFSLVINRSGRDVEHVGEYREIDRPGLLVFTWVNRDESAEASRVIMEITPGDPGCEVKLTHVIGARWSGRVDQAAGAWSKRLDALERLLRHAGVVPMR